MFGSSIVALSVLIGPVRRFVEAHAVAHAAHPKLISAVVWFAFYGLCGTLILALFAILQLYGRERAAISGASPLADEASGAGIAAPSPQNL